MKDTITLAELRQTELYRREQTRPLIEFLMENIDVLKLADEFQNRKDWKLINYIHWAEQSETMLRQQQAEIERLTKENRDLGYYIDGWHKWKLQLQEFIK